MEEATSLFHAVFSRLLETLAGYVHQAFIRLENIIRSGNSDEAIRHYIQEDIFASFPRESSQYRVMIETLAKVSQVHPVEVISYLVTVIENVARDEPSNCFSNFQNLSPMYKQHNIFHKKMLNYFELFLVSDLLCQICVSHGPKDSGAQLAKTAYDLCQTTPFFPLLFRSILKQWSVILSIVSETKFEDATAGFAALATSNKFYRNVFRIVRFVRLDMHPDKSQQLLNSVIQTLKTLHRRRQLNYEILHCVSQLVQSERTHMDIVQNLFDFVWGLRRDRSIKTGVNQLLVTLLQKPVKLNQNINRFYKSVCFDDVGDDKQLRSCLDLFHRFMCGSEVDLHWLYWEWGVNIRASKYCFLGWNSQPDRKMSDSESFAAHFMNYFFPKANFQECPDLFADVILHLASLDFEYFLSNIVPSFTVLPISDPRFITLLMTVPKINNDEFHLFCVTDVNADMIRRFNESIRPKVIGNLKSFEIKSQSMKHGVISIDESNPWVSEADENVQGIVEDWNLTEFSHLAGQPTICEFSPSSFSLYRYCLKSYLYLLTVEDLKMPSVMNLILLLAFDHSAAIANAAMALCSRYLANNETQAAFVRCILDHLASKKGTNESEFVCMSLLLEVCTKRPEFDTEMIYDIEYQALFGFVSTHPHTRHVSYRLLYQINELLQGKGLYGYIYTATSEMEKNVKRAVLMTRITEKPYDRTQIPKGTISFHHAAYSHFYDMWLFFVAEIADLMVEVGYTPLLARLNSVVGTHFIDKISPGTPINIAVLLLLCAANTNPDIRAQTKHKYVPKKEPHGEIADPEVNLVPVFKTLLESHDYWMNSIAFEVMKRMHPSLLPPAIWLLSSYVNDDNLIDAADMLVAVLRMFGSSAKLMARLKQPTVAFIATLQSHIIRVEANAPRVIHWTFEREKELCKHTCLIRDFCMIVTELFRVKDNSKSIDDLWPVSGREVLIRFLINWGTTKSDVLQNLRKYVAEAIIVVVRTGSVITDNLLFDYPTLSFFGSIERQSKCVLSHLLSNHVDLLLNRFTDACFMQPFEYADVYFESLFAALKPENSDEVHSSAGIMLLVGFVFRQRNHSSAEKYLLELHNCLETSGKKSVYQFESLPSRYVFATESVIFNGLKYIQDDNCTVPVKDIVESIRPWLVNVRLLPTQAICVPGTPSNFRQFTPYKFLEMLMHTTEQLDNDDFLNVIRLWTDLLRSPDHSELVPLFIAEHKSISTKRKMFMNMIPADSLNIVKRLVIRCTFAYHFHVTTCHGRNFDQEMWVIPLLEEAFKSYWDDLKQFVPKIIHFCFLFGDREASSLMSVLCDIFGFESGEGDFNPHMISNMDRRFIKKIDEISPNGIEQWGLEAIRWLLGSQCLKHAWLSMMIYNKLMKPYDNLVVTGVCKSVVFHLGNSDIETEYFTEFVGETFTFYTNVFCGNELYAYQFAESFLDCRLFIDSCLPKAVSLFFKSLTAPTTNTSASANIISIVRPLIKELETSETAQKFVDTLIKTSRNEELMMVVAPIKNVHPRLFESSIPFNKLITLVSVNALFKVLDHYVEMLTSVSAPVVDSIFYIVARIIKSVSDENISNSLVKLYKVALNNISKSRNALEFICTVSKVHPTIATKSAFEFYEWDRSIDDVERSLARLIVADDIGSPVTVTDCSTIRSVYSLLNCEVLPKILPFETQREIIDSMKNIHVTRSKKRSISIRRTISNTSTGSLLRGSSTSPASSFDFGYEPLQIPEHLDCSDLQTHRKDIAFVVSPSDFLTFMK